MSTAHKASGPGPWTEQASPRQREFSLKLEKIRQYLSVHQLGAVALSQQSYFAWATAGADNHVVLGSDLGEATLLVSPQSAAVLTNNIEIERIRQEQFQDLSEGSIEFWSAPWYRPGALEKEIQKRLGPAPWASDTGLQGSAALPKDFAPLTYTLTQGEIERYRRLGLDCSQAMEQALSGVSPGMTEQAIAGQIANQLLLRGVRPHVLLVAADERIQEHRHPIPSARPFTKHLMAVLCGKRSGLIINLTRFLHVGPVPPELARRHEAVCRIELVLTHATRPGRPLSEVLAQGIQEYERLGFAEQWKLHHQGGPTGYQGRSFFATPEESRTVQSPQAYAWNPSITGAKSEDTILVEQDRWEYLSAPTPQWPTLRIELQQSIFERPAIKTI